MDGQNLCAVLSLPIFNACLVVFMWFTGVLIEKAKLQIDHNEPLKSFAQHMKYRRLMGNSMGAQTVAIVVLFMTLGFLSRLPTLMI